MRTYQSYVDGGKKGAIARWSKTTPEDRFWSHVEMNGINECWPWKGTISTNGYGKTSGALKHWGAHRMAYVFEKGEIPKGMCVCHTCDNKPCCNPNHLFLGTPKDNAMDKSRKGRAHSMKGESHPMHKLTEHDVLKIRVLISKGNSDRAIAALFNIAHQTANAIRKGITWRHI